MLSAITRHIYPASPKSISHWTQYISTLQTSMVHVRTELLRAPGYESRAIQLLRHILALVDVDYMRKQDDDYSRYLYYVRFMRTNFDKLFNPVTTGRSFRKAFIEKKLFAPNEYLVPVDDVDHMAILPMDAAWESWKAVRPVRIWDHDSPEYTLNLLHDRIAFHWIQPTWAIITIDVVSLVFMYFKYLTDQSLAEEERTDRNFLHKYVIPGLMDDLLEIWLFKQVNSCAKVEDAAELVELAKDPVHFDSRYGFAGHRYQEAMKGLLIELDNVAHGTTSVNSLLSSPLLPNRSILDRINILHRELDVAHLRQYQYIRFMMELPLMELIVELHSWQPKSGTFRPLMRDVMMKLRALQRMRFWNTIYDPVIKHEVEDQLNTFYDRVVSVYDGNKGSDS